MKWLAALLALLAFTSPAWAANACSDPSAIIYSAAINVGAATTGLLVGIPANTNFSTSIHVCSFVATLAGTTPTVKFVTGTQVTNPCDTNGATISGTFAPTSGNLIYAGWGGDLMVTAPNVQLCATTTGTGSSFQGVISYTVH